MLVVGDKEAEERLVAVRERTEGDVGQMGVEEFAVLVNALRP
jgi:threonyl-tRNA synthetase